VLKLKISEEECIEILFSSCACECEVTQDGVASCERSIHDCGVH
jgi:hypothetical protein